MASRLQKSQLLEPAERERSSLETMMQVTIERSRIDPNRLYGNVVNESDDFLCLHREIDFQLDGYIFLRNKDITSQTDGTPAHRYHETLMRKEGYWVKPDRFVQKIALDSWETILAALVGKPVLVENERKSDHCWVGIVDACTRTTVTINCFDTMGVFDADADRIPLRSITSIQYGDRYTQTHFKHLKPWTNKAIHRSRGSAVS
jgi:hypothetical protein